MFKKTFCLLFAILTVTTASAANREQFTGAFTFGDSFSYQSTWTDFLMQRYGIKYADGQNGFAIGGQATTNLQFQLSNYTNTVKGFDGNALYLVFMGASDAANSYNGDLVGLPSDIRLAFQVEIYNIILFSSALSGRRSNITDLRNNFAAGKINVEALLPNTVSDLNKRAALLKDFVSTISSSGARYIVVLNNFKNMLRWRTVFDDFGDFFNGIWVNIWNNALYSKLNELPSSVNIILVDTNRFLNEVTGNPSKYFTSSEIAGTQMNGGFFDGTQHPTASAHKLFSQYVASILESPSRIAMVRELPLLAGSGVFQAVTAAAGRFSSGELVNRFTIEMKGDYMQAKTGSLTNKELGFRQGKDQSGQAVINARIGEEALIGTTLGRNLNDINFVQGHGKATVGELGISVHAACNKSDPLVTYFTIGLGNLNYSIRREIPLGIGKNVEFGKTKGRHYLAMVGAGYRKTVSHNIAIVPHLGLSYQRVTMKPYGEKGDVKSTTMSFNIADRKSLAAEMAVSVEGSYAYKNIPVTSTLTAAYSYDFINPLKKQAKARVSDVPRQFFVPTYKMPASFLNLLGSVRVVPVKNIILGLNGSIKPLSRIKSWSLGLSLNAGF